MTTATDTLRKRCWVRDLDVAHVIHTCAGRPIETRPHGRAAVFILVIAHFPLPTTVVITLSTSIGRTRSLLPSAMSTIPPDPRPRLWASSVPSPPPGPRLPCSLPPRFRRGTYLADAMALGGGGVAVDVAHVVHGCTLRKSRECLGGRLVLAEVGDNAGNRGDRVGDPVRGLPLWSPQAWRCRIPTESRRQSLPVAGSI